MSDRRGGNGNRSSSLRAPRLELTIVSITVVVSAVSAGAGLAVVGFDGLALLAILLLGALLFNLAWYWLGRGVLPGQVAAWGTRLANLAFLTGGVYLTGSLESPFLTLYALYLVVAGLRFGWSGVLRSFALCALSWGVLALASPPAELQSWVRAAMSAGALVATAVAVGVLAQHQISFEQESRRRDRELTFLREAGQSLGASLEPGAVLAETLARVNELLDVEAASLALVDPVTGRITFELAIGGGNESIVGLRLEPGQGIVGHVVLEGSAILVPDVSHDPRWFQGADQVSGYQTRSILCVPLRVKGQVMGALEVLNKRDGPFTEEDQRLLSSLAGLAAQAIENARLHDQIRQHVEQLQEAYEELQRLDELKSAFIRNVSHELRTPLALIEGYLEMVIDGQLGPLQAQQLRSLSVAKDNSALLTAMVNDIISLQTIGDMGFDLEVLALDSLVWEAMEGVRTRAEKASICLELDASSPTGIPAIRGDARRLRQVFDHLLDNAIKFSPNGGTVRLTLRREVEMVCVRIRDEGIGLSGDEFERVFDRFYQVDGSSTRRYGGTGLGLALVKEVVEAHGGGVWVESEADRGSTFTVCLPSRRKDEDETALSGSGET
jgi:signal transduction histidine kinase